MSASRSETEYKIQRQCPCCGKTDLGGGVSSSPKGEDVSLDELKKSWFGFFKTKVFFTFRRCKTCDQLYSPWYFTRDALTELYGVMPDNTAGVAEQHLVRTQRGYFDFLRSFGPSSGDYLELGPDVGLFAAFCSDEAGVGKYWLFEPNIAVHSELSKRVGARNLEISTEMDDFGSVPDDSVGTCVLIHVLDHLPQAQSVMRQLAAKLRADGRMIIVTHDERSLLARILGHRWPAYCLQHPQLFNTRTTKEFLSKCGLQVLATSKSTNYFPATYLLKHLLYALGFRRVGSWSTQAFAIPLRLGNIMTVATKATSQN
jgi:Methyltransferase domain